MHERTSFFNLIVTGNETAWETDDLMRIKAARFGEYSDDVAEGIDLASPVSLKRLAGKPTLLMYEDIAEGSHTDWVRYGKLRNISQRGNDLTFRFTQEGLFRRDTVREYGDRLGIDSFEFNRTHWAVKAGRLPSAMRSKMLPTYDVVFSFAGENRQYVEKVAKFLLKRGVRLFCDTYEQVQLWGMDLAERLDFIYQQSARFCVIFVSRHYLEKMWPNHERQSAVARAIRERGPYILPGKFDDSQVPGVRHTLGYVDLRRTSPAQLGKLILERLNSP
jgi:hypothetical protein